VDAGRDGAEARRLGLPRLDERHLRETLMPAYAAAGLAIGSLRPLEAADLARWPTTWAKRLAHGRVRSVLRIEARARGAASIAN
jgi:hypothetical protein